MESLNEKNLLNAIFKEVQYTNEFLKNILLSKLEDEKSENNKIEEEKTGISIINGLNDYDKIILKNLESRISILEEESQKYFKF